MVGSEISHYKITAKLGEGGMGEVYLAEDTRLMRRVALKVLPEELVNDADRLARMQREAQVLAQLSHANVAAIHGLEEHGGRRLLVMEYAEGSTLAQRLTNSGPLPLDDCIDIAVQVAEGLEAAHEKGVVHRDLKPANVMVADDASGKARVKLLDFGLAKAYAPDGSPAEMSPDLSKTPTVASPTLTGTIMGTAAYMSPEQARGKPIDRRADVWAFGCLFYEMLTGAKAFDGETVSDTLASILKEEPDYDHLPEGLPGGLRDIIERCLRKDPTRRLRDIGDVKVAIEDTMEQAAVSAAAPGSAATAVGAPPSRTSASAVDASVPQSALWWAVPWAIAALMTIVAAATYFARPAATPADDTAHGIVTLVAPESHRIPMYTIFAVSPTRTEVAYPAEVDGEFRIFRRGVDRLQPDQIAAEEAVRTVFYSPDGETVGFSTVDRIRRVARTGGPVSDICTSCSAVFGAAWAASGAVVVSPAWASGLQLLEPDGTTHTLTDPATDGGVSHVWPQFLPGDSHVLFTIWSNDGPRAAIVPVQGGEVRIVAEGGEHYRYLPPDTLLWVREGTLVAKPFDLETMTAGAGDTSIHDGIFTAGADAFAAFEVSARGTLVFRGGAAGDDQIVELDRGDAEWTPVVEEPAQYNAPRYSPSEDAIAYGVAGASGGYQVAIYSRTANTRSQLTFSGDNLRPLFSPDGGSLAFTATRDGSYAIVRAPLDGRGEEEVLYRAGSVVAGAYPVPTDWSEAAGAIVFNMFSPQTGSDLFLLTLDGDEPVAVANSEASESGGAISPNGRWIAYASNRTGRSEIYVRALDGGAELQLTTAGGQGPRWNPAGGELLFRRGNRIIAVTIDTSADRVSAGDETVVLEDSRLSRGQTSSGGEFAVSADGQRILIVRELENIGPLSRQFHVLQNLPAMLRTRGR